MTSAPLTRDAHALAMAQLRRRRLWQLQLLVALGFGTSLTLRLSSGQPINAPLMYLVMGGFCAASAWALQKRLSDLSAGLLLAGLTGALLGMVLLGEGLRDEAVVALPGVLVIAALLGNRRQLATLAAMMVLTVLLLGLGHMQGWYLSPVVAAQPTSAVEIGVILAVTAFGASLLAGDLASEVMLTQRARAEAERLAHYDPLTGLPNRRLALDRFEHAARGAARTGEKVALLLLDLDRFKDINDALGHAFGDRLLAAVAQQLPPVLRGSDTVARLGGDEFLVVLEGLPRSSDAGEVAAKLLDALAQLRCLGDTDIKIDGSVGIAIWPDDGGDFDTLHQKADIAMYRAKEAGRQCCRYFDAEMDRSVGDHLKLVAGLRHALARGELQLHYQPQFDLRSGRLIGAEALLRWESPTLGRVSPVRFVPVAEQSGQIVEIGAWVLQEACRQTCPSALSCRGDP
jgi:diguanylate cyclase (GGDEF)-like protein